MNDFRSFSASLPDGDSSSLINLISDKLLETHSDANTVAVLESFTEVLDWDRDGSNERISHILASASLELVPLLSPLLSRPAEVRSLANSLLIRGVGTYGSPREVMLAVGERIEAMMDEIEYQEDETDESSEEEEEEEEEEAEDKSDAENESGQGLESESQDLLDEEGFESEEDYLHDHDRSSATMSRPHPLLFELPTLLNLLVLSIPRLTTKKSLATCMNLSTLIPPVIQMLPESTPGLSRVVMDQVRELVDVTRMWAEGKDDWSLKGEQNSILLSILTSSLVHLYPNLDVQSAEYAYANDRPDIRRAGFGQNGYQSGMDSILQTALRFIRPISPSLSASSESPKAIDILPLLTSSSQGTSTFALLLLSHHLSTSTITNSEFFASVPPPCPTSPSSWLENTLESGTVRSARSGGIVWVRCCLSAILDSSPSTSVSPSASVDAKLIRSLWDIYLPPMATSPSSIFRQLLFDTLKQTLHAQILDSTRDALAIVHDLVKRGGEAGPMVRITGVHFLRSLIVDRGIEGSDSEFERIGKALQDVPFGEKDENEMFCWETMEDPRGETWIRGPGPAFVVLTLGVYQLLLNKDPSSLPQTIVNHLRALPETYLRPLRAQLDIRSIPKLNDTESVDAFETVTFALEGVEDVWKSWNKN